MSTSSEKVASAQRLEGEGGVFVVDTCRRHADPAGAGRRGADDQFRQVRPLRARQYRLCRDLWLALGMRRERKVAGRLVRETRTWS